MRCLNKYVLPRWEHKAFRELKRGDVAALLDQIDQRREKVATMRWDDLVDGEWRIPIEQREKSNAGALRLPPLVLDSSRSSRASPIIATSSR